MPNLLISGLKTIVTEFYFYLKKKSKLLHKSLTKITNKITCCVELDLSRFFYRCLADPGKPDNLHEHGKKFRVFPIQERH